MVRRSHCPRHQIRSWRLNLRSFRILQIFLWRFLSYSCNQRSQNWRRKIPRRRFYHHCWNYYPWKWKSYLSRYFSLIRIKLRQNVWYYFLWLKQRKIKNMVNFLGIHYQIHRSINHVPRRWHRTCITPQSSLILSCNCTYQNERP